MIIPEQILLSVEKPARYIGNEINAAAKDPEKVSTRFALCFPDVYEVGMSHLGLQILYFYMNRRDDVYCERAFAPWTDMEKHMREERIPLHTLETCQPLAGFDFVGFTLQYELSYTNLLNMLELGGIPLYSRDRMDEHPIVCAGGPCSYNPEPLADIVDFFYIGEGEAEGVLDEVFDRYTEYRANGGGKRAFLERLTDIPGIYVPCFYDVTYTADGLIESVSPNRPNVPETVHKVICADMDSAFQPGKQIVPMIEAVQDRAMLEVFRGCMRGCRFCQAGFVSRPMREKSPETLLAEADSLLKSTGHEEISLLSLSTGDYTSFQHLADGLVDKYAADNVNLSLPSLRVDAFSLAVMNKIQGVRKSSLTFAPEAGTQRLRDVINKGMTEEEILKGCRMAFDGGWNRIKLYFMIGLPTETEEDVLGIVTLSEKIVEEYYKTGGKKRPLAVAVSVSSFVPKPFTPFQWEAQDSREVFVQKQLLLKQSFKKRQIQYSYHDSRVSVVEAVLARGDRRAAQAVARAWELGARFDGWSECFRYEIWEQAFKDAGISVPFYAERARELSEMLPWSHISVGVDDEFFKGERQRAYEGLVTKNCREGCSLCGAQKLCRVQEMKGGVCVGRKVSD